jgi:hypothetical protein
LSLKFGDPFFKRSSISANINIELKDPHTDEDDSLGTDLKLSSDRLTGDTFCMMVLAMYYVFVV